MFSKKNAFLISVILFVSIILMAGCFIQNDNGYLSIVVETWNSRGIEATSMDVHHFNVSVETMRGVQVFFESGDAFQYDVSLTPGVYIVKVDAYNEDDVLIGHGENNTTVMSGIKTVVSVTVEEVDGDGYFIIDLTSDGDADLAYEITDSSGTMVYKGDLLHENGSYNGSFVLKPGFYVYSIIHKTTGIVLKTDTIRVVANKTVLCQSQIVVSVDGSFSIINDIVPTPKISLNYEMLDTGISVKADVSMTGDWKSYWILDGVPLGLSADYEDLEIDAADPALYVGPHVIALMVESGDVVWAESIDILYDPYSTDSDGDGLADYVELIYGTDPTNADTDGDGANDFWEIQNGFDPLVAETSFDVQTVIEDPAEEVSVGVSIKGLSGEQAQTLEVSKVEEGTLGSLYGAIGSAYEFKIEGDIQEATISFEYDEALNSGDAFDPQVVYLNETTMTAEIIPSTRSGNTVCATVNHFSKYILVNKDILDNPNNPGWRDRLISDDGSMTTVNGVEVVLAIDDSGSLGSGTSGNDPQKTRLTVAKNFIDQLPAGTTLSLVRFDDNVTTLCKQTKDKELVKGYLTSTYFNNDGLTELYKAVYDSANLFLSSPTDNTTGRFVVVLTDGKNVYYGSTTKTLNQAKAALVSSNAIAFTVGFGGYDASVLQSIADSVPGGMSMSSTDVSGLAAIYKDIGIVIDILTDSDSDGIPDYYEKNLEALLTMIVAGSMDKDSTDSDGDGYLDGEELQLFKYITDEKVLVFANMISDPTDPTKTPLNPTGMIGD